MRLTGKICARCGMMLDPPERPGDSVCAKCLAERQPHHKIYVAFFLREGWYCQFLEADLKTSLPRKLRLQDSTKLFELAEKGNALKTLEDRQALEHGIENGRGGIWLELTNQQYQALKRRPGPKMT